MQTTDVMKALNEDRSIVRTWLMRGTLHLIASDDLSWMLGILGPVFAAGDKARHAQLGLDATTKSKGIEAIRRILSKEAPLTRYEIVDRLQRHGITLDPKTQGPIHLIAVAALNGVICLGPDRENGESTYVLINDWIGTQPAVPETPALRELAQRYFSAYGPASVDDFVAWSGLPVPRARTALHAALPSLVEISIAGRSNFLPKGELRHTLPAARPPSVRLLPAFDTYLLGYRSRELAVPAALQKRLQRGGGWLHPTVVANGRAVAAWSWSKKGARAVVDVEGVETLPTRVREGIRSEIADIGRFLN